MSETLLVEILTEELPPKALQRLGRTFADTLRAELAPDAGLLDEVTALVEAPAVYVGEYGREFLDVPPECLVLSMKQHQKYFPLLEAAGRRLLPRFLLVSNLRTENPENIVR